MSPHSSTVSFPSSLSRNINNLEFLLFLNCILTIFKSLSEIMGFNNSYIAFSISVFAIKFNNR